MNKVGAILGVLLIAMFIFGCSGVQTSTQPQTNSSTNDRCPDIKVPSTLIPIDRGYQDPAGGESYFIPVELINKIDWDGWASETRLDGLYCRSGSNRGENINNLYCHPIMISKTFIDEKGNILGTARYRMDSTYSKTPNGYELTIVFTSFSLGIDTPSTCGPQIIEVPIK